MNIWICVSGEPLPTDGEDVRLRRMGNFAIFASSKGHYVEWFSNSFEHYTKRQRCNKNIDIHYNNNLDIHLVKSMGYKKNISIKRILSQTVNAKRTIRRIKRGGERKPDIIITVLASLARSSSLANYAKNNKIPFVVDVRDLWPEVFFDVIPDNFHFLILPFVKSCEKKLRYALPLASGIIGLSPGFLEYGLKYANRGRTEKDTVIPIGYPDYCYADYKERFTHHWEQKGLKKEDFIVTFLGNFGDQFSFGPLIEASKLLENRQDIKFVLCGTGSHLDEIKSKTGKNVIFPGWIEKEQIASLLCFSNIGVIPYIQSKNYKLNTPNKFGEYTSAGLPILVSVDGIMEQYVTEKRCGFRYTDGKDLANKIETYYEKPKLRREHSRNSRELYLQAFNVDAVNDKLIKYLTKIIGQQKIPK